MHAMVIGSGGLTAADVPVPQPDSHQMLVKVRYAALNRADLAMAAGHKHGAAGGHGAIGGLEWSGEVVEVGDAIAGFKAGDPVMGSGAGAYAEYVLADPARCHPIPAFGREPGYDYAAAATLPVALQTMHDAIVTNAALQPGESLLVQGASSGVGIFALQLAKWLGAALVIGSSTSSARRKKLQAHGADTVIDSRNEDWPEEVKAATQGHGVDVIIDQVSGYVMNDNMRAAALCGRIVNVGRLGGMQGNFDFDLHARKRLRYVGVTFRTRTAEEVRAINDAVRRDLWPALEQRLFDIPVDRVFSLEDAADAQAYMRANKHFGKVLLAP